MALMQRVFRFGVVGVTTAALHMGLLYAGVELLRLNETLASSLGFAIVVIFNYMMHYSWTFTRQASHGVAVKRYTFMIACGFLINGMTMYLGATILQLNYLLVQTAAIVLVITWNSCLSLFWVFRAAE